MTKRTLPWLVALVWLLSAVIARAQSFPPNTWHTFDAWDGVAADWVFDIAQTPDAGLWFATDGGVLRFDGAWAVMDLDGLGGMPLGLTVDGQGRLWVGTEQGLVRWKDGHWLKEGEGTELAEARIHDVLSLPDGGVLAASPQGLFRWDEDGGWHRITGLPLSGLDVLAMDGQGALWIAQGHRVFRQRGTGWEQVPMGDGDGFQVTAMTPDAQGGMWIGTQGQGMLHVHEDGQQQWETQATGLPSNAILSLMVDDEGALWVGTNGHGAARWDGRAWHPYTAEDGLASNFVSAMFQDGDGVLWFGTPAGVTRYDAYGWIWWQGGDAPSGPVFHLAYDEDGDVLWAVDAQGVLHRLADGVWEPVRVRGRVFHLDAVETLAVDDEHTLWIGTREQGVLAYGDGHVRQWRMKDGLAENDVTAIAQTPDPAWWFGTRSGGVSRKDETGWQTYTRADGLLSDEVTALLADASGGLWVGTREGLSMWDGASWHGYTTTHGLPADEIVALAQDGEGTLWVATWGGGLAQWDGERWNVVSLPDNLQGASIEALAPAQRGVWVGTPRGLSRYDGLSWQDYRPAYGYPVSAVYALAGEGHPLFLGAERGVGRFWPDQTPPQLSFLSINGQTPQQGQVAIEPEQPVHVVMQGTDLHTPSSDLLYLLQVEGVDADWRLSKHPILTYPSLEPGEYAVRAMVRDAHMNYSPPQHVTLRVARSQVLFTVPGLGHVHPGFALLMVIFLTLFAAVVGYAGWTTALRWHMRQQAVERRFNPYIAGSPIRSRDMFFGREQLLQDLKAGLAHNSMMIYGERRIGKTSLLYRLLEDLPHLQDKKFRYYPIFVDLEGTPQDAFFHVLMEGLLDALQPVLADFPAQEKLQYYLLPPGRPYTDRHMRRDLRQIISYLKKQIPESPRLIFLLDEVDTLSRYDSLVQQQFRRILQDIFAKNVGAVISGVYISKTWDRMESPWYNMFVEIQVPPLNRYEAEMLMRKPVLGFYDWDDEAVAFVWERTQGRPHRIQQIAREAVNRMLDEGRRRITLEDVEKAYDQVVFAERLFRPWFRK